MSTGLNKHRSALQYAARRLRELELQGMSKAAAWPVIRKELKKGIRVKETEINPCQAFVNQMAGLMSPAPVAYRILQKYGRPFTYKPTAKTGEPQQCYQNAYHGQTCDLVYAEGYAMKPGLIPLNHAWLVDSAGNAIDPTWDTPADYFGVKFDPDWLEDFTDRTGYYGVFEGLYMLKLPAEDCYRYLVSGVLK